MRRANVYFKPQWLANRQGERTTQSTGFYLARSVRTLGGLNKASATIPITDTYTHTKNMHLCRHYQCHCCQQNSEEPVLLRGCLDLQYIGPVYRG